MAKFNCVAISHLAMFARLLAFSLGIPKAAKAVTKGYLGDTLFDWWISGCGRVVSGFTIIHLFLWIFSGISEQHSLTDRSRNLSKGQSPRNWLTFYISNADCNSTTWN
ncbi:MAG: hypothetical protein H8D34_14315 [Chloroflexi bacterium]|nr:hypothetical protein [Chloroflexota bacterium]